MLDLQHRAHDGDSEATLGRLECQAKELGPHPVGSGNRGDVKGASQVT